MNKKIGIYILGSTILILNFSEAKGQECFESSILSPTPFMGNNSEVFKLANGLIGEIVAE